MNYLFGTGLNKLDNHTTYSVMGISNADVISTFTQIPDFQPSAITTGTDITGNGASIAVDTSGNIWVVGSNSSGFLGIGPSQGTSTWTKVSGLVGVPDTSGKTIASTNGASFVIGSNGTLYVCGTNMAGFGVNNLGLGITNSVNTFTAVFVGTTDPVEQVVTSNSATMFMTRSKKIYATGSNMYGQMNAPLTMPGYKVFSEIPVAKSLDIGSTVKGIDSSFIGTFYVISDSDYVYSWGSNSYYLLGRKTTNNESDYKISPVVKNINGNTMPFPSFRCNGSGLAIGIGTDGFSDIWGVYDGNSAYQYPTLMPVPGDSTAKVKNVWAWGFNYAIQTVDGKTYLAGNTGSGQSNFNDTSGKFLQLTYLTGYDNALYLGGGTSNTFVITNVVPPPTTTSTTPLVPPGTTTTTTTTPCPGFPCSNAILITPLNTDLSHLYCPTTVGYSYGYAMFFYFIPDHKDTYYVTFKAPGGQGVAVGLYFSRICNGPPAQSWTTTTHKDVFDKGVLYIFQVQFPNGANTVNYSIYYGTTTTTTPCPGTDCFQATKYETFGQTQTFKILPCDKDPYWITLNPPFSSDQYKLYCAPNVGRTTIYGYNNYNPPTSCGTLLGNGVETDPTFYSTPQEAKPKIVSLSTQQKYVFKVSFSTLKDLTNFKLLIVPPVTSTTTTTTARPVYWSVCDPCLTGGLSTCKLITTGAAPCEYARREGPFDTLDDCINLSTPTTCFNDNGCGENCC